MPTQPTRQQPEATRPRGLRFLVDAINLEQPSTASAWMDLAADHGDPAFLTREIKQDELVIALDTLRAVFTIQNAEIAAKRLNALLKTSTEHSTLTQLSDDRWALRPNIPADASAAEAIKTLGAFALAEWFAERGRCAWGICAASDCERVFIDEGRRQPQQYCSTTCSTRTRVSAHRQRQAKA